MVHLNDKLMSSEDIERNLKKNKRRIVFSILFFLFCATFGFIFLVSSPSFLESELIGPIALPIFIISFFIGFPVFILGANPMKINSYYNRIAPLNFNHISLNSKFVLSKKDEIYIMYLAPVAGIYFIESNITGGQSSLYQEPKELPRSFIKLNKKITLEGFTFKLREFSGFFKIPLNEEEYVSRDAKVMFMPLKRVHKFQGSTENINKILEYVKNKPL
jgi:hypothetical protein